MRDGQHLKVHHFRLVEVTIDTHIHTCTHVYVCYTHISELTSNGAAMMSRAIQSLTLVAINLIRPRPKGRNLVQRCVYIQRIQIEINREKNKQKSETSLVRSFFACACAVTIFFFFFIELPLLLLLLLLFV